MCYQSGVETVRLAVPADLETLVQLAMAFRDYLLRATPTEEQFRSGFTHLLADPATEFVLARGVTGNEVAYLQLRFRRSAWNVPCEAEIEDLFVLPSARRRGLGQRIIDFALDRARARGAAVVGLTTNERNLAAIDLYHRMGFRAERERWSGGRQLWMDRELGD